MARRPIRPRTTSRSSTTKHMSQPLSTSCGQTSRRRSPGRHLETSVRACAPARVSLQFSPSSGSPALPSQPCRRRRSRPREPDALKPRRGSWAHVALEVVAVDDHRPFAVKLLRALAVELFERERSRPDVLRAASSRAFRSSAARGCFGVVDRAETAVDVVVDHADVLHERVHARRSDKAVPLRFQLLRERLSLRGRRGEVCD
jgi:hypothetical protein